MSTIARTALALPFAVLLTLLLAHPAAAGRYSSDHDRDADFTVYRSVAWRTVEPIDADEAVAKSDLIVKRVRAAALAELKAKGLTEAPAAEADLLLELRVQVRDRIDLDDTRLGRHSRNIFLDSYTAGTAILDLVDRRSGRLVWRGWIRELVRDGPTDPDDIAKAVGKLFREYPPKKE